MVGQDFAAAARFRGFATVTGAFVVAGLLVGNPTRAAAQGPPAGIPGQGQGPVVLEGEFEATYEDDGDRGRLLHFIHSDNRRIPLRFRDGAPDLPTGAHVRISGDLAADGEVTATGVTVMTASTSRTLGPQDILVILFNFSNNASQPWTMSTINSVNEQVKNFYLENTYGQTVLSFTTVGYYTIAATNSTCDYYTWATQAEAAATNAGVNINAYDRRILAFPHTSACSWAGVGNLSGPRSWINSYYDRRVVSHEQGHNFGDNHSKATHCSGTSSCTTVEYGDDRDVMGSWSVAGHFNAFQKERLGWLNYGGAPAAQTVSTSGHYWIDNFEMIAGSTKALKIWNPAKNGYYYVESRAKVGFDASIAAGVTLHLGQSGQSYQVDLDPSTSVFDSTLDAGQVFTDPAIGLTVETVSSSVDGAMIAVTLQSAPCTTANPSVSLAASGAMQYAVTVKNNNSSGCAASVLSVTAGLPSGWTAAFSPASSASLAPGASASATMTLTPPSGATGTHAFTVTGTDTSSGKTGSTSGTVSVSSPLESLSVSASATYDGGKGNSRSATIRVSVRVGTQGAVGAAVSVVVADPRGVRSTLSGTTDAGGSALFKFSLRPRDPGGVYQVQVSATSGGAVGQASTSFNVP